MVPDIEPRRLQPTRFQRPTTSGQHAWLDRDAEEDIAEGHDVDRQSMMHDVAVFGCKGGCASLEDS